MMNDLNLKGILAILLLVGATLLAALGRMTVDQWTSFAELIFGTYAAAKAATTIASTIASRPQAPAAAPPAPAAAAVVIAQPDAKQAGFVRVPMLLALAVGSALLLAGGCGISADTAVNSAASIGNAADAAFLAYDHQHEADLLAASSTRVEFDTKLATYLGKRKRVDDALLALRDAIDLARTAKDNKSIAAIAPAALAFEQAVTALKEDLQ